jgi:Interferon-induced transmembrane protein
MNFEEAERQYRELRRQYDAGTITSTEFDNYRERLKLQDERGVWWVKGRDAGIWYYWDGNAYIRGNPPISRTYAQTPPVREPGSTESVRPPGMNVPGYLLPLSIGTTLFCCPATGIVAIVYSVQAGSKSQAGDSAGASQAVRSAKLWLWLSVGGFVIIALLYALGSVGSSA